MSEKRFFLLLLQLVWLTDASWAQQRSAYSLQAAVDELHRREAAKYPLNAPPSQQHFFGEQDYFDDDNDFPASSNNNNNNNYNNNKLRNRHRLNKALAKYLERENYDNDNDGLSLSPFGGYEFDEGFNNPFLNYPDERKRSSYFRERDNNPPSSVFRERESQALNNPEHAELTEQFLREIEEAQEREREERYKEALRHLWEKYQQQENEIQGDLFQEKKRMRTPPYYMLMQKKRSYPVLPWLPYSAERKKRFPVTKRSTTESQILGKTDDKVAKELSELFGAPVDEKKKRSIDEKSSKTTSTLPPNTPSPTDMHLELHSKSENGTDTSKIPTTDASVRSVHHPHQHKDAHHNTGHQMASTHHHASHESHSDEEDSEEGEEHDDHEEEGDDDDDHEDFEEDDGEERKKKRDVSHAKQQLNKEVIRPAQILHNEMMKSRRKKSVDWSKYFGLDRKKKSMSIFANRAELDRLDSKKPSTFGDASLTDKKNHELDPDKLDNMDKKLQSIEDFIIAETIKYTGAHEGIANPEEIRRLKDHVLSRLATAYSLEKMRRALEKLRQSVDNENHLRRNIIETESEESNALDNQKRVAIKKEKAPTDDIVHNEKSKDLNSLALQNLEEHNHGDSPEMDENDKRKKKRNGYLRYPDQRNDFSDFEENLGPGRYETLNDAYLGNKNYMLGSNQCPLIESMAERCRSVDLLSGDLNQELLPICGVHQICYLCGTSQVACDYQYLAEADSICGNNNDCEAAARSVLMILRGTPGPQLGPRECLKDSCLHSAMREIGL